MREAEPSALDETLGELRPDGCRLQARAHGAEQNITALQETLVVFQLSTFQESQDMLSISNPVRCNPVSWLAFFVIFTMTAIARAADEKPEKNLQMGVVVKLDENNLTLRTYKNDGLERKVRITERTKFSFVGFKGLGQNVGKPAAGFGVKAHLGQDDVADSVLLSPDYPPLKPIPNRHKLSAEELFNACDQNKDGRIDYVEYATSIFQSSKHLPDRWQNKSKMDTNGDDTLDLKEFSQSLNELAWWRLSRHTPEAWLQGADQDKTGELNIEELKSVIGSAHGKLDQVFKKLDKNKSGGISVSELTPHLEAEIADRN